ncbi:MAG: four helix bundle protein [Nitrospira sp.]|nr:four helix bundle protein [Nitrospira sp.]
MKITHFEDLDCWKEARQLTRQVYEAIGQSSRWQKDIRLCGQIQGAAGSVMANIAEGFVRHTDKEFTQFLFIAMSSAAEVQSHLYIAVDQGYLPKETFESIYAQAEKASRIISGLIKHLRKTRQTEQTKQTRSTS